MQAILTVSPTGNVKEVNSAAELLFESPRSTLVGMELHKLFADKEKLRDIIKMTTAKKGESEDHPVTILTPGGKLHDVSCNLSVYRNDGKVEAIIIALYSASHDVASGQLSAIVESSSDAILSATLDGVLTSWNRGAENIFGFTKNEMIGKHVTSAFQAAEAHHIADLVKSVVGGYEVEPFEIQQPRGKGEVALVSVKFSRVFDSSEKIIGVSAICREVTAERLRAQAMTAERDLIAYANTMLSQKTAELARQARQMEILAEISGLLQVCEGEDEVYFLVAQFAERLFPETSGALFGTQQGKTMECGATWGTAGEHTQVFLRNDCFAARRVQPYVSAPGSAERCPHIRTEEGTFLCFPLLLREEIMGVLAMNWTSDQPIPEAQALTARLIGDAALALANIRLRQKLKELSIRDPLTGLYNRRYMEEFFAQELIRSERKGMQLSIVLFDCDHFKTFNDTHGHDAGDLVLKHLAKVMRGNVRASDVICRYGGEEFIIVMPDAPITVACDRAELVRSGAKNSNVLHDEVELPPVTLSMGIAGFPAHGNTMEAIIKRADDAMYEAKRKGRDCVCIASAKSPGEAAVENTSEK